MSAGMRVLSRLLRRRIRAPRIAPLAEARLTVERARAALAALPSDRQCSLTAALLRAVVHAR
jgi:hypothetical protein